MTIADQPKTVRLHENGSVTGAVSLITSEVLYQLSYVGRAFEAAGQYSPGFRQVLSRAQQT